MPLLISLLAYNADVNGIIWPEKSWCTSFWSSWSEKLIVTKQCHQLYVLLLAMVLQDQKSHIAPPFDNLDTMNSVVPFMMLSASCNTDTDANDITWKTHCSFWSSWPRVFSSAAYDAKVNAIIWPKSPDVPHFNCSELRSSVVPFTMLLISYDASADASGITWWKSSAVPYFDHLYVRNSMLPSKTPSVSWYADASGITWWNKSFWTSLWSSWPKEIIGTIYHTVGIM